MNSKLISHDSSSVEDFLSSTSGLKSISADSATLLGSPLGGIDAISRCLVDKVRTLLELMGD